jgi:phosphatidylserine/phosphatidylglycerophosphate/cardiolipin synthase-like enzyme
MFPNMRKIACVILFSIMYQSAGAESNAQSISVCFTPNGNCAQQVIDTVAQAKRQVLVQAYSFTSAPIAQSLVDAKNRGVDVEVLLDKSQLKSKNSVLPYRNGQNIATKIDYLPAIAHNKIMIIDDKTVITGSYNFTTSAEKRNTENLLIIHDKELAKDYVNNWVKREMISTTTTKMYLAKR